MVSTNSAVTAPIICNYNYTQYVKGTMLSVYFIAQLIWNIISDKYYCKPIIILRRTSSCKPPLDISF